MKKIISLLLTLCILLGMLSMGAFAAEWQAGDVSRNGKVTAYDALLVQSHLHNEYQMDNEQMQLALDTVPTVTKLSTAHVMATLFIPLTGKSQLAPEPDGRYHIREPQDMELLRTFPFAAFVLENNIDMSDAGDWKPFVFHGNIDGQGYAISSLNVTAANGQEDLGLFTKLTDGAVIFDLKMENCVLNGCDATRYVGAYCGTCCGTIVKPAKPYDKGDYWADALLNVTACGANAGGTPFIGTETVGAFGRLLDNGTVLSALSASTPGLTGAGQSGSTVQYYQQPYSLARQWVIDYMNKMATVQWKVTQDVTFVCTREFTSVTAADDHTYVANRTYTGMPYGNPAANLETLKGNAVKGSGNVYTLNESSYVSGKNVGSTKELGDCIKIKYDAKFPSLYCNDCSGAVLRAWQQVAPNIKYFNTEDMVPSDYNCSTFGIRPVGENMIVPVTIKRSFDGTNPSGTIYPTSWSDYSGYYSDPQGTVRSEKIVSSIVTDESGNRDAAKVTTLWEQYAKLKPGDAVVYRYAFPSKTGSTTGQGHARMVTDVNVARDPSGNILPYDSFIVCTEQCGGDINTPRNNETIYADLNGKYTTWKKGTKYSFAALSGDNTHRQYRDKGNTIRSYEIYVPVTCAEFAVLDEQFITQPQENFKLTAGSKGFFVSGVVSSDFPILLSTLTLTANETSTVNTVYTGLYGYAVGQPTYSDVRRSNDQYTYPEFDGLGGINDTEAVGSTSIEQLNAGYIGTSSYGACRATYYSVDLAKHDPQSLQPGVYSAQTTVMLRDQEKMNYNGIIIVPQN